MINDNDLRWLAGVVDSVGLIYVRKQKGRNLAEISVTSRDEQFLKEVARMVGAEVTSKSNPGGSRRGCAEHCPHDHIHIPPFRSLRIHIRGSRASVILWNVLPYLRVKHSTALNIVEQAGAVLLARRTKFILDHMAADGWQIPDREA